MYFFGSADLLLLQRAKLPKSKAPNELFILSTDAITKIHASKSGCRKRNAGLYNVLHYKGEYNLDSILDREEHRWRRQIWERAMTTKG